MFISKVWNLEVLQKAIQNIFYKRIPLCGKRCENFEKYSRSRHFPDLSKNVRCSDRTVSRFNFHWKRLWVSHNNVKDWINILEASFVIFLLRPHFNNFNKRLIKSHKTYFYDTGLLRYLLGIESPEQSRTHYLR